VTPRGFAPSSSPCKPTFSSSESISGDSDVVESPENAFSSPLTDGGFACWCLASSSVGV